MDPGTRRAGYGVVVSDSKRVSVSDMGTIRMNPKDDIGSRMNHLMSSISAIVEESRPDYIFVERVYVAKSAESSLKLKMANGVVHQVAARYSIPCEEVSPSSAKKCVTRDGSATKNSVRRSVQRLCQLDEAPPSDAADAVAIALCGAARVKKRGDD